MRRNIKEQSGWLIDLYEDKDEGLVLWFLSDRGERLRLHKRFVRTFFIDGDRKQLQRLQQVIKRIASPYNKVKLFFTERRSVFHERPLRVLGVEVDNPVEQGRIFRILLRSFPGLEYYDADIPSAVFFHAQYGVFPLGWCQFAYDEDLTLVSIAARESCWSLHPSQPPLRVLSLHPSVESHASAMVIDVHWGDRHSRLSLSTPRPTLICLESVLKEYDADVILTAGGDKGLLVKLEQLSEKLQLPLSLNRDAKRKIQVRNERTYFSYGQIIHRGRQAHLFGRLHIDVQNAMMYDDYGLDGIWELARVSGLPLQVAARVSPGTCLSAMQWRTAIRQGFLIPWRKQQAEEVSAVMDLIAADQGGMVYQPLIGVHKEVAELDFISMYPSIMVQYNISPETVSNMPREGSLKVPAVNLWVDQQRLGIVPRTLAPLLRKRIALKRALGELPQWNPAVKRMKAQAAAHKWLLVTSFGYLGYKNARFGKIESHQAVTAFSREDLLGAKEIAEDLGFTVLHMMVDGLWVSHPEGMDRSSVEKLIEEISVRVGLPIALEGIYRWLVFLPSRADRRVAVPNRYFGVFEDGSIKMRGIEARRHDTPAFIARTQIDLLKVLAQAPSLEEVPAYLPQALALLRERIAALQHYRVPLQQLIVKHKLTRNPQEYRVASAAARAASQLLTEGKQLKAGQSVRFIYTTVEPGVMAIELTEKPSIEWIDVAYYRKLLLASAETILQPFGIEHPLAENNLKMDL